MVVRAIGKVYKNGKYIGWNIMDEQGNVMDATTESIKKAIITKSATVLNLVITQSGELQMMDSYNKKQITKNHIAPSYFGIQIKNLKKSVGREGEAYQGDVWLYGKKLGFWSQDANGCISDRFEFDKYALLESLHKHQQRENKPHADTESLMNAVLNNIDNYKQYKNMVKKGAKSMIVITDYYGIYVTCIGARTSDLREIESKFYDDINKYKEKYTKPGKPAIVKIYTSEDDFIIE